MTKDVLVSVYSYQTAQGQEDSMEVISKGTYYIKNGQHYVVYEEVMEGFQQPVKCMLKFKDGFLTVTKKGLINVNMVFDAQQENTCDYATPYGTVLLGIVTHNVTVEEKDDFIKVSTSYTLKANYEDMAECQIKIEISSKERGIKL